MAAALNDARPRVGLLLGDPSGIGPEIVVKLLAAYADARVQLVVLGAQACLERGARQANQPCPDLPHWDNGRDPATRRAPVVFCPLPEWTRAGPPLGAATREAGLYCLAALRKAVRLAQSGAWAGFAYAPMNKAALHLGGSQHPDDMGLLNALFRAEPPGSEVNVLDALCTARVTSHIPLAAVPARIATQGVVSAIERLHHALEALAAPTRTMAVAGLNPHAGEGGLFGTEEAEILVPAIAWAQARGLPVTGPYPADTVFVRARQGEFGGVVTMYHDQGQIAMKLLGFERGFTYAAGLPIPVTTTGHGTAFDITGQGRAHPGSLQRALQACIALALKGKERSHAA